MNGHTNKQKKNQLYSYIGYQTVHNTEQYKCSVKCKRTINYA